MTSSDTTEEGALGYGVGEENEGRGWEGRRWGLLGPSGSLTKNRAQWGPPGKEEREHNNFSHSGPLDSCLTANRNSFVVQDLSLHPGSLIAT